MPESEDMGSGFGAWTPELCDFGHATQPHQASTSFTVKSVVYTSTS